MTKIAGTVIDRVCNIIIVNIGDGATTTTECADVSGAEILYLSTVNSKLGQSELTVAELSPGMSVSVYGMYNSTGCLPASVVLATDDSVTTLP